MKIYQFFSRQSLHQVFLLATALALGFFFSPVREGTRIFIELGNLTDVLRQISESGILAIGMTVVILTAGVDLSVGAILAFSATLLAKCLMVYHWGLFPSVLLSLAASAGIGAVYAVFIEKFSIPPFITTLAAMGALRGAARLLGGGTSIAIVAADGDVAGAPHYFFAMAEKIGGVISFPAVVYLLTAALTAFFLARTTLGRHVYAVGGNLRAARFTGISVFSVSLVTYVICALCAGAAGILHAAQLEQGNPNDGFGYELDAIAAVVLGGTRLSGGVGGIGGTVIGTLVIGILNNILGLNNIDINLQLMIKGALILAVMAYQQRSVKARA